jgi:putative membrane protein
MRSMSIIIAAAVASLAYGPSFAQNANPQANRPANPAPTAQAPAAAQPRAPEAGANAFTETQAKSQIEASGYTNVSALRKDEKGMWHGTAMKDGKSVQVSLDVQGKVAAD